MIVITFDTWDELADALGLPDYEDLEQLKDAAVRAYPTIKEVKPSGTGIICFQVK